MATGIHIAQGTRTVYALLLMFVIGLIIIGFVLYASGVWWTGMPDRGDARTMPFATTAPPSAAE